MIPTEERFWAKVHKTDGCWLWTGTTIVGYGSFSLRGHTYYAHRWAYETLVGPIPDGYEIDHLCRVRHCVNPAHLEAVTRAENIRRTLAYRDYTRYDLRNQNSGKSYCVHGHAFDDANTIWTRAGRRCRECRRMHNRARAQRERKGTGPLKGEENSKAKLTATQVLRIRERYQAGATLDTLAGDYGVDRTNIWCIVKRKTWKHI